VEEDPPAEGDSSGRTRHPVDDTRARQDVTGPPVVQPGTPSAVTGRQTTMTSTTGADCGPPHAATNSTSPSQSRTDQAVDIFAARYRCRPSPCAATHNHDIPSPCASSTIRLVVVHLLPL